MTRKLMTATSKIVPLLRKCAALLLAVNLVSWVNAEAQAQDIVTLKIRNNVKENGRSYPSQVEIRSLQSLSPQNPWRTIDVEGGRTGKLQIQSPDNYIVRVSARGVTYESAPIALKKRISENPNFELKLSLMYAAPAGQMGQSALGLSIGEEGNDFGENIEMKRVRRRR